MMYMRSKTTVGWFIPNFTFYAMVGWYFQLLMLHRAPAICNVIEKKAEALGVQVKRGPQVGEEASGYARISFTFRATGSQARVGRSDMKRVWGDNDAAFEVSDKPVTGLSFAEYKDALYPDFTADTVIVFNRLYENAGRMSATYGTGSMTTYRFSGKNVAVKPMPAILLPLMEQAIKTSGVSFNWVHVVYYPDGNCKLDWHADNEQTIARGSTIVGFTMYENPTYLRPIEIRRKPEPKVKSVNTKRKTSVDLTTMDCAKKNMHE
jgi:hypothetical protein